MYVIILAITFLILLAIGVAAFRRVKTQIVPEDSVGITVDRDGFIERVLPAGRHVLRPFEKMDFVVETKAKLAAGQTTAIAASDGLLLNVNWSGVYALSPELITEKVSQRLRGLSNANRAIARNVDICLRKLVGHYAVKDIFKPAIRDRIERQLGQLVAERVRGLGIVLSSLNLQAIELPAEVAEALNKAKAIEALDEAIRQIDPTTREVVRGVYQLDEVLRWDAYLPTPSRLTVKRLEAIAR
ncbi:MAG: SPFH domain-containing protein [Anaerolineae bacterium]|nr:SPFH domain-containing protein [Anaerolineae bacterium]